MFYDYSMLVTSVQKRGVHFRLIGTNRFHAKAKNERFTAADSHFCQNFKNETFTSLFGRLAPKCVPHFFTARLFFLIQIIKSLICGLRVAIDVVIYLTLYHTNTKLWDQKGR